MTKPLAFLNTRAVTEVLVICGVPALQTGSTIELASDQVGVDEACSGIRSLHAALMVSLLLGELFFLRPRSRVILLGGGVILDVPAEYRPHLRPELVLRQRGGGGAEQVARSRRHRGSGGVFGRTFHTSLSAATQTNGRRGEASAASQCSPDEITRSGACLSLHFRGGLVRLS